MLTGQLIPPGPVGPFRSKIMERVVKRFTRSDARQEAGEGKSSRHILRYPLAVDPIYSRVVAALVPHLGPCAAFTPVPPGYMADWQSCCRSCRKRSRECKRRGR